MLYKLLWLLPICAGILAQDPPEIKCDTGFELVGDQCLKLLLDAEMSQTNALIRCLTSGSGYPTLARVNDTTQLTAIISYLYEKGNNKSFWLDGNDNSVEGHWVNTLGDAIPQGTPFWLATESISTPNGGDSQNCAEMSFTNGYLINDAACNEARNAICESAPTGFATSVSAPKSAISEDIQCPLFYVNIGGKCFALITWEVGPWEDIVDMCKRFEGYPAIIDDINILRDLYNYVYDQGIATHSYWTSGMMDDKDKWLWHDGSNVTMGSPFWGNSDVNKFFPEPDGNGEERCLALTVEGQYFFRDKDCSLIMNPLCMADAITS